MILALLTGRGNSSLKNKNILKLNKKPVLSYACEQSKKVKSIKHFFVSSDDENILNSAKKYGFNRIKRPSKLSRTNSLHHGVLIHAIRYLKKKKITPEIIVVLLANAPIIKNEWIDNCIKMLKKDKNCTAVVPVIKDNDKHPLRSKKIKKRYLANNSESKKKISSNRQDLENCYFLCHNFWVIKTKEILKNDGLQPWSFMGKKVLPYPVKNHHDIHNKFDLKLCELILNQKEY
tara:strand:+ start:137 stop:835 length:699 start_codon:yes stop_codon:yes gene_type:complete